jgi:hypothetical protein
MKHISSQALRLIVAGMMAVGLLLAGETRPTPPAAEPPRARPGVLDVLEADPRNLMYSYGLSGDELGAMRSNAVTNASATFSVTYDAGFDAVPAAKAAFQAAVDIWSNVIASPVPIRIRANFVTLGSTTLGSAGPTVTCTATGGVPNTYYAAALADKIRGFAYCASLGSETHELVANFNSNFSNWDFGTSGTPVSNTYNFLTVVMHEIGHGLGFYGDIGASGGVGSYSTFIAPYDRFAESGAGVALLSFPNNSTSLGSQLVSGDTYFDGTNANANNGGQRPKLETRFFPTSADNGFRAGSSYSHADDALYTGTSNGLMTYALSQAEVYTDPGPIVRGIFQDLGWSVANPLIAIESPSGGATVSSAFTFSGYALDRGAVSGTGVNAVHVYATPSGGSAVLLGAATYGSARSDVAALYGSQFANSGFSLSVSGLSPGSYQLTAYGFSTVTQTFAAIASVNITVTGAVSSPVMAIDSPQNNTTIGRTVEIVGWALDLGAASTTGVDAIHVYAYPVGGGAAMFLGVATYGLARPDIGGVYGAQFTNSGYSLIVDVVAGNYDIVAFSRSTVANAFSLATIARVTIQATNSNPTLLIDTPLDSMTVTRPFTLSGWAIDRGAPTGTGIDAIHVWVYSLDWTTSTFVGVGAHGAARPDIGSFYGSRFTNSGFSLNVNTSNLAAGSYNLVAFGLSSVTGSFTVARVVRVTVQ